MIDLKPEKKIQNLEIVRPQWARVMVFQVHTTFSDWKKEKGLYYPHNKDKFIGQINSALSVAERKKVNLLVFPELSVPKELLNSIQEWSSYNDTVVIAGTHYDNNNMGNTISKCPVIFKNKIYFTEKIDPAPGEMSPLPNQGLSRGQGINIYKNTPVGNFAVLICSDNLMNNAKDIIKDELLDFWIIPSFQRDSSWHYKRMNLDVEGTRESRYIIYANNKLIPEGDGGSSFFGVTNKVAIEEFNNNGYTKKDYSRQIITLNDENDFFILDVDINFKRPNSEKFPHDSHNVKLVEFSSISDQVYINEIDINFNKIRSEIGNLVEGTEKYNWEETLRLFHKFIVNNYLKHFLYYTEQNSQEIFSKYSESFLPVLKIIKGDHILNLNSNINIFEQISRFIIDSNSSNPLLVDGYAGCGKTSFLSVLYLFLYEKYKNKETKKIPLFINLHYYNKQVYPEKSLKFLDQAKKKLLLDLDPIYKYIRNNSEKEIIIIIDGTDDYVNPKVDLDDFIVDEIRKLPVTARIIGLRKHRDEHNKSYSKKISSSLIEDPEIELELHKVRVESPNFIQFIDAFSELEAKNLKKEKSFISKYLTEKIRLFKIEEIDLYLVNLFLKGVKSNYRYGKAKSLSSFYKAYLEECKIDTSKSSELAFKMFNRHEEVTDKEKNREDWWLIQKHETIRDYLVANNIVKKLIEFNQKNQDIFNFVYPFDLNNFCKEIINEEPSLQRKVFQSINRLIYNVEITAKTHFCYLLGRFEDKIVKEDSKLLLNELKIEAEKSILERLPIDSTKKLSTDEKKGLLYLRTIYISLTYLGDEDASSEYIKLLLKNKYFDNLNRGFHLEYYEDITFSPASPESLKHEDNLNEFDKTFIKLFNKLNVALQLRAFYPLFEIELYTLCSLAQHRQVNGNLDDIKRKKISDIISMTLDKIHTLHYDLYIYIKFIRERLKIEGKFKVASFTKDLFMLKSLKRKGWVKRNVYNPETVASHMYGAYILGYLHLPSNVFGEPNYNKSEILRMILIHDLGEAYVGDLTPTEKTSETSKNEERQIEYLSLIGTYEGLSNLTEIVNLFKNFTHDKKDINCIIAREIDKLDNLLQLFIYHFDSNHGPIEGFEDFKEDLIQEITTSVGRKILNQIEELFDN